MLIYDKLDIKQILNTILVLLILQYVSNAYKNIIRLIIN